MFTQKKFNSLTKPAQHKKIAELLKKLYFEFDNDLYHTIKLLESYMGCEWTKSPQLEILSNSFHRHLQETGRGISEHDLWVKTGDKQAPSQDLLNVVVYLDRLRSAHNVGNIIRTVEAFRLGQIAFSDHMPDLNHPKIFKSAMGAEKLVSSTSNEIKKLPRPLIAVETHQKAIPLESFTFPQTFTLILGNEEGGVSSDLLNQADHIIQVPLVGQKNSLNVAACFSIIAWRIHFDLRVKR